MSPHARHTSSSAVELSAEECGERSSSGSNSSSSGCTCGGDAKTVSLSARVCVAVVCVRGCVVSVQTWQLDIAHVETTHTNRLLDRILGLYQRDPPRSEHVHCTTALARKPRATTH